MKYRYNNVDYNIFVGLICYYAYKKKTTGKGSVHALPERKTTVNDSMVTRAIRPAIESHNETLFHIFHISHTPY